MGMPSGRYLFGTVKVGERGQIIIPKEARETFGIKAGDTLIVMGDENWGIAVTKADILEQHTNNVFQKYHLLVEMKMTDGRIWIG